MMNTDVDTPPVEVPLWQPASKRTAAIPRNTFLKFGNKIGSPFIMSIFPDNRRRNPLKDIFYGRTCLRNNAYLSNSSLPVERRYAQRI